MPKWTADQENAIYAKWRNKEKTESANILVNAAAGSGKTAVLVERIINKLCAPEGSPDRCSADNLLVVTFTNAAAKEMQGRIYSALSKKYAQAAQTDSEEAEYLKRQLSLIHSADITTIDAFCLKEVRSRFHLLGIDPDFKIADSAECEMLKDDCIEELFEQSYRNEDFCELLNLFSDGRDDTALANVILNVFNFTRSQPNPDMWMEEKSELMLLDEDVNPYFRTVKAEVGEKLCRAAAMYKSAIELMYSAIYGENRHLSDSDLHSIIAENPPESDNDFHNSFGIIYKICANEYSLAKSVSQASWNEAKNLLESFVFEKINASVKNRNRDTEIKDSEILNPIKDKRAAAKKLLKDTAEYFFESVSDIQRITREHIYPMIRALIKYVKSFEEVYNKKKSEKNLCEFSDIEHMALRLFSDFSEVSDELKSKYTEILMDEYQDSNALQEAIFSEISRGNNQFTVGDMKQSIYRFRSSDPDIFKSKCDTYTKDETALNRKIVLSKNFRSRKEVLDGINSLFDGVMSESVGGVDYDDDQRLYCGDSDYEQMNTSRYGKNICECCVIVNDKPEENGEVLSETVIEARYVAKRIREMYDSGYLIRDKRKVKKTDDSGNVSETEEYCYRPVQYKDFAIIMSSPKYKAAIYKKELAEQGIDCYTQNIGYFDRPEIKLITALLKVINNPYNDIPLIAVMRSPIFGFSDDELCRIRMFADSSFYDCVKKCSESNEAVSEKCFKFLDTLGEWKYKSKLMPADKLIWYLYEESSIYSLAEAIYGSDAAANLRLLFMRAKKYENSGYKGLFNFIRFIGKLKKNETDLSTAAVAGENGNVVRLMTIHKSKGLEFPVVFFADSAKEFNSSDASGKLIMHKDLGFGADYINFDESFYMPSIEKKALVIQLNKDMLSEEMRKLYVGLTRAKEKLIVTAVAKMPNIKEGSEPIPRKYDAWSGAVGEDKKMKKSFAKSAESFIDWIAPIAMADSENWIYNQIPASEVTALTDNRIEFEKTDESGTQQPVKIGCCDESALNASVIPVKLSVTELNESIAENGIRLIPRPGFLDEKTKLTGAQRGTAIHYVMQKFIPFDGMTVRDVDNFINRLNADGELSDEEAAAVNPQLIIDFYLTELGKRILKSEKVVREAPFELKIPASDIFDGCTDEQILLQGIIDLCFYENDEIVIVDYKTDSAENIGEIKQKYKLQLEYYKLAAETICKKTVKNVFLYLFSSKSVIEY